MFKVRAWAWPRGPGWELAAEGGVGCWGQQRGEYARDNAVGETEARILGGSLFSLSRSKSQLGLNPGPQPRAPSLECSGREWGCL